MIVSCQCSGDQSLTQIPICPKIFVTGIKVENLELNFQIGAYYDQWFK